MKSNIRKIALVVAMLALMGGLYASRADATKPDPKHKVTICHKAGNSGHYTSPTVDVASTKFKGHNGHAGDIIPAFSKSEGYPFDYPGKNWDDAGKAIHANDCKVPVTETTEPPTTDTTATTETTLLPPTIIVCDSSTWGKIEGCNPPPPHKPPTPPAPPAKPHKGHAKLTG